MWVRGYCCCCGCAVDGGCCALGGGWLLRPGGCCCSTSTSHHTTPPHQREEDRGDTHRTHPVTNTLSPLSLQLDPNTAYQALVPLEQRRVSSTQKVRYMISHCRAATRGPAQRVFWALSPHPTSIAAYGVARQQLGYVISPRAICCLLTTRALRLSYQGSDFCENDRRVR